MGGARGVSVLLPFAVGPGWSPSSSAMGGPGGLCPPPVMGPTSVVSVLLPFCGAGGLSVLIPFGGVLRPPVPWERARVVSNLILYGEARGSLLSPFLGGWGCLLPFGGPRHPRPPYLRGDSGRSPSSLPLQGARGGPHPPQPRELCPPYLWGTLLVSVLLAPGRSPSPSPLGDQGVSILLTFGGTVVVPVLLCYGRCGGAFILLP